MDVVPRSRIIEEFVVQIVLPRTAGDVGMFSCMLGDNEIEAHSTDALASAGDAIGEQRRIMRATSARQDEGHPALIIREALAQGDV